MLKTAFLLTLLVAELGSSCMAQSAPPQATTATPTPVNVVLQDGTALKLRLGTTAEGNGVRVGETLELEVAEDVRVGDVVVIAKGSTASAAVTNLRSGGNVKGGWIDINLDSVTLSDGERVSIRASKQRVVRADESSIVSSQSQDASISQGADLTAFINGNKQLDLTRLRAAGGPTTTLKVTSSPSNAEVTLDGRLAGSTPNTLHVANGDHIVLIRLAGFQASQRKIHVEAEPVALDVALSKLDGSEPAPVTKPAEASLGDLARAARTRKQAPTITPVVLEQDGAAVSNQPGQRDPTRAPKK
jgi:hypothetical protein